MRRSYENIRNPEHLDNIRKEYQQRVDNHTKIMTKLEREKSPGWIKAYEAYATTRAHFIEQIAAINAQLEELART